MKGNFCSSEHHHVITFLDDHQHLCDIISCARQQPSSITLSALFIENVCILGDIFETCQIFHQLKSIENCVSWTRVIF